MIEFLIINFLFLISKLTTGPYLTTNFLQWTQKCPVAGSGSVWIGNLLAAASRLQIRIRILGAGGSGSVRG
jgi:hypothetical protein